jgi:hypothetical protein
MTETTSHLLAAAVFAAGLILLADSAHAAPGMQDELINRPISPFLCLTWQRHELGRHDPWLAWEQGRCRRFDID